MSFPIGGVLTSSCPQSWASWAVSSRLSSISRQTHTYRICNSELCVYILSRRLFLFSQRDMVWDQNAFTLVWYIPLSGLMLGFVCDNCWSRFLLCFLVIAKFALKHRLNLTITWGVGGSYHNLRCFYSVFVGRSYFSIHLVSGFCSCGSLLGFTRVDQEMFPSVDPIFINSASYTT